MLKGEVKLQDLLKNTVARLFKVEKIMESFKALFFSQENQNVNELKGKLTFKWGFDGATGQSQYKKKKSSDFDDSSLF